MNAPSQPPPWEGRPYSVKRDGVTIANCDAEPVRTPGCVQAHGALLVLRPGDLTIAQASENCERLLGLSPERLLGAPVAVLLGDEGAARLRAVVEGEPIERNPLYVHGLARAGAPPLDVTVHTVDGAVVVEFEAPAGAEEPDYYALVKRSMARFQTAASLRAFCEAVTDEVRALTGFDRVMVYRFHADFSGEVYAESRRDDLPTWLGLRYPAEDIPRPAREVFERTWVRPVPDVSGALAELVPLAHPDTGRSLEMTWCALRGPSVMYTEYLRNMRVAAGLTMPIRRDDGLWGLIACHHYVGPKPVSYRMRAACELLAQVASLHHRAAEEREHLMYRLGIESVHQRLIARAAQQGGLSGLAGSDPSLLDGLSAGGAALYYADQWWRVGATPSERQLDALADWLETRPEFDSPTRPLYATDRLGAEHPPAAGYADVAAGLLAFPLSRARRSLLLWFRPETVSTVDWGGNPHDKPTVPGPHGPRLTPRRSFELWRESVHGQAVPWAPVEVDAAARLRLMVMELVVSRAERLAELNTDLSRSNEELDAFAYVASHDLKEPLRGIHKYAHELLEADDERDRERRRRLDGLMRLTVRMDNLLDSLLHFSRVGRVALQFEPVDLDEVLAEAVEMVDARRAESTNEIVVPRPLPRLRCDRIRVREILVNLLSNALKYNVEPVRRVEIGWIGPYDAHPRPGCPEGAAHQTILYVRDNGIGIEPRHHEQVFKMFKRLHGRNEYGGGTGAGLTIVRKLVERHRGHVWIDSAPGRGTTFYFTLADDGRETA